MAFRVATDVNGIVLAFGPDEGQSGDYGSGAGTWETFSVSEIPQPASGVLEYVQSRPLFYPLSAKVVNGEVVSRTLEELILEYGE